MVEVIIWNQKDNLKMIFGTEVLHCDYVWHFFLYIVIFKLYLFDGIGLCGEEWGGLYFYSQFSVLFFN